MRIFAGLCVAGLLVGCEPPPTPHWREAPQLYVCTEAQMDRVEREHLFCDEHTSQWSAYCYGTAMIRNCTLRTQDRLGSGGDKEPHHENDKGAAHNE